MSLRLNASDLVKRFGARELFHIRHFELEAGEGLHLQGQNGAGKTTLMKILAGLEKPSSGRVQIIPDYRRWWSARPHPEVIYLHQTPYLFAGSVAENVRYGLKLRGGSRSASRERVAAALAWARLEPLAAQEARALSGGEKQRLALARAWVLNPRLLLLDEPTANLDESSVATVAGLISELLGSGTAVMVSSHQRTALTGICQRRLQLKAGRLLEVFDSVEQRHYAMH